MVYNVIALVLLIGYLYLSQLRNSRFAFERKGIEKLRFVHCVLAVTLLFLWILSTGNIYLRGFWSTKIIIWLFFFSAVALFVLGNNQIQSKYEKRYFGFFYLFPVLLPLFTFINPYGGIGLIILVFRLTTASEAGIYYSDSKYRIQEDDNKTSLCVKKGLYEIRKPFSRGIEGGNIDSTTIIEKNDTLLVQFYYEDWDTRNNPYPFVAKVKLPD